MSIEASGRSGLGAMEGSGSSAMSVGEGEKMVGEEVREGEFARVDTDVVVFALIACDRALTTTWQRAVQWQLAGCRACAGGVASYHYHAGLLRRVATVVSSARLPRQLT